MRTQRAPGGPVSSVGPTGAPGPRAIAEWDELVRGHPAADVAQLSGWARVRAQAGFEPVYVLADDGGSLAGGAQVLVRRFPGIGAVGYVPYGPLVADTVTDPRAVLEELADELAHLGRRQLHMLFVQPPLGAEAISQALLARGFRHSDSNIAPAASLHVDLRVDEKQLRRNLSRRLQTWTNQWEARGVTVRRGGEEDLPVLARLLADTAAHQGFTPFGVDYLATMYRELAPGGHLQVFIGEAAGRPVAMDVLTGCGEALKVRLVGLDRLSDAVRLNVPGAVRWTAMRWAKENDYRWFDFGGLREASMRALESGRPLDPEAIEGPDRYKVRFGGVPYRYPQPVELISSAAVRLGYDLARRSPRGQRLLARAQRITRAGSRALDRRGQDSTRTNDHSQGGTR